MEFTWSGPGWTTLNILLIHIKKKVIICIIKLGASHSGRDAWMQELNSYHARELHLTNLHHFPRGPDCFVSRSLRQMNLACWILWRVEKERKRTRHLSNSNLPSWPGAVNLDPNEWLTCRSLATSALCFSNGVGACLLAGKNSGSSFGFLVGLVPFAPDFLPVCSPLLAFSYKYTSGQFKSISIVDLGGQYVSVPKGW